MALLNKTQRKWATKVLVATAQWLDAQGISSSKQRFRVARMVLMCVRTESAFKMYANRNIPTSLTLPHDAIGYDHNSVGLFQQQVGTDGSNSFGWGTVAQCMDAAHSTKVFLNRLNVAPGPEALCKRIQDVQVSAYADGSNYQKSYYWAYRYLLLHWSAAQRKARQ